MKEEDYQFKLLKIISGGETHLLEDLIIPAGKLNEKKSLEIYQNDYLFRLSDSLSATYEATHTLLGDEDFLNLTKDFIKKYPSCTTDLNEYGEEFPHYIQKNLESNFVELIYQAALFENFFWKIFHQGDVPYLVYNSSEDEFLNQKIVKEIKLLRASYNVFKIFNDARESNERDLESYEGSFNFLLFKKDKKVVCENLNDLDYHFFEKLSRGLSLKEAMEETYEKAEDVQNVFKFLALNFL